MGRVLADLAVQTGKWSITPSFRENQVKVSYSENEGGMSLVVAQCSDFAPVNRNNALIFPIQESGQLFQIEQNLWNDRALALSVVPRDYEDKTASCRVVVEVETVVKPSSGVCNMPLYNPPPTAQWIPLELGEGWIPYGEPYATPACLKSGGVVYLRGGLKNLGSNFLIATLPEGYRPPFDQQILVTSYENFVTLGNIVVMSDGAILYGSAGAGFYFSLDGVVFHL